MFNSPVRLALAGLVLLATVSVALLALPSPDAVLPDGGRYHGPLVDGRLHGEGRLEWDSGAVYTGRFRDGLMSGQGHLETGGGNVYEGEFEQGLMHGEGRMETPAGDVWEGRFERDLITEGTYRDSDGNLYEGEFENWLYHGRGRLETVYGEVLEGRFETGRLAEGTYTEADGASYEGEFTDGLLQGEGRHIDFAGNVYIGGFVDGQPHGTVRVEYADGAVYEGDMEYGMRHGEGSHVPADGGEPRTGTWVWDAYEGTDGEQRDGLAAETLLYNQTGLLDTALAGLEAGDPETIDLYLLAIAGDGSQEVFRREAAFAQDLFDRRFATRGRSLTLVNSRNSYESLPMATRISLERTLGALAERMDAEDILFLYLTSHGSRDHRFMLDQNEMMLPDLKASELSDMLAASGIRWKVVVISACYSGGFIEPVGNDTTMVITAAASDRQSFGCSDEADFTYFGRAFLEQALAETDDFRAAFDTAVELIRERESGEDISPGSQPQIHAPDAVLSHLKAWRQQKRTTVAVDISAGPVADQRPARK